MAKKVESNQKYLMTVVFKSGAVVDYIVSQDSAQNALKAFQETTNGHPQVSVTIGEIQNFDNFVIILPYVDSIRIRTIPALDGE